MSIAVGVDIGAYKHAVAVCRAGEREADRRTVQISANRAGFRQLASWMETLGEPVSLVVMESSGHYWVQPGQPPASRRDPGGGGEPAGKQVLWKAPAAAQQKRQS